VRNKPRSFKKNAKTEGHEARRGFLPLYAKRADTREQFYTLLQVTTIGQVCQVNGEGALTVAHAAQCDHVI